MPLIPQKKPRKRAYPWARKKSGFELLADRVVEAQNAAGWEALSADLDIFKSWGLLK